jgi:hypothetical protein
MSDPSLVLSIAGTIIAICALTLSIWEGRQSRKHDRLSVRPLLMFHHERASGARAIILKNSGLGPAILKQLQISVRDQLVTELQEGGWPEVFHMVGVFSGFTEYYYLAGDDILDAGTERTILRFDCTTYSKEKLAELDQALSLITMRFKYESMYHERFDIQSRKV